MVPRNWQDQYKLTHGTVPQSVCKLLDALECIKKVYPTKKEQEGPKSNVAGGGTSKKRMVSFSDPIPKKSRKEAKHCTLCKKHRDAQNTKNAGDCKKYNSDGPTKKGFTGNAQCISNNRNTSCKQNTSYMQLYATFTKIRKFNRNTIIKVTVMTPMPLLTFYS